MASVEVIHSSWSFGDGESLPAGRHENVKVTKKHAPLFAGAAAAGAIRLDDLTHEELELLNPHVQSQEDGEAAYAAAQADGSWQEGNLAQHQLDHDRAAITAEHEEPGDV